MNSWPSLHWQEAGQPRSARWRSENGTPPPGRVVIADDSLAADAAYRLVCEGSALLWRGDFQNARQLLLALARRVDRPSRKALPATEDMAAAFHHQRQVQVRRARLLSMLLLPFDAGHRLPLRRAPDVHQACSEAYGAADEAYVASMRELLGLIGAHEWRKKGVAVAALGARVHPHYGVFAPVRGEYIELVNTAPLPATDLAFDIGTGTGVLAAVLASRGVERVVATDMDSRALVCAGENLARLGWDQRVSLLQTDLFPEGKAPLIVCNPPWVPARPNSALERAVYDPDSRMLRGFLAGAAAHLAPGGEAWLVLSDIAEHFGLRSRETLLGWIADAGLVVVDKLDIRPRHPRAADVDDPLHQARRAETTSLWRLAPG